MIDKNRLIDILANAVDLGMSHLPDGKFYEYCWEECTDGEQKKVKMVRNQLSKVLEIYEAFINETPSPQKKEK